MTNSVLPVSAVSFSYQNRPLRVEQDTNGDPLFHVGDLCAILEHTNPRQAVRQHVDPEDVTKRDTLTAGGKQETLFVREPGMWSLLLGSHAPAAQPVKRWVTAEVLPVIRKTGRYEAPLSPQPPAAHRRQAQAQNRRAWTLTQALYPWVLEQVQAGEAVPTADELRDLWRRGPSSGAGWPAGDRRVVGLRPDGTFSTAPLPKGALLCAPAELPRLIADAQGGPIPCTLLPAIISAAADRLGKAVAFTTGPLSPPAGK